MLKRMRAQRHIYLIVIAIILVILLLWVVFSRVYASKHLKENTQQSQLPVVATITAKEVKGVETIVLPGNVQAWHQATVYARTNGYVKRWLVDIGAHVQKDQLLAEIETPELDAQLRQAQANLNTAIANNQLAQTTSKRWVDLLKSDSVSKQETDEKVSGAKALAAAQNAAEENYERLKQLVGFERVIAPFTGVITNRSTDIGALINAGSSLNGVALFRIAQTNPLRIYVFIPQNYTTRISPQMSVQLAFAEHPGQTYPAQLMDTAKAIDPSSRTLLAQFKIENSKGTLLPGGYTEVIFKLPVLAHTVRLPVNTLLFRAEGLQVATLDKDNKVRLKSIKISRDFGAEVEIQSGIQAGEKIIINPPDSITNGESVRVMT